jgi:hypothetical protein
LGCRVGAVIPHLPDTSTEAVVEVLDRTQPMATLGLAPSRCSPETRFRIRSGIAPNPHRLHAMAVGVASCERSGDIV